MKKSNTILLCILICSIAAFYATDYIGGYMAFPLAVAALPAVLFPALLAFLTFGALAVKSIWGLINRSNISKSLLNIAIVGVLIFIIIWVPIPGYLHGLRDRFKSEIGYEGLREFAHEFAGHESLQKLTPEVTGYSHKVLSDPNKFGPLSSEEQKIWDEFANKYEFLHWNLDTAVVSVHDNVVQVLWGSALPGHWGFQVALNGQVQVDKDAGRYLKVANDIQFLYVD